MIKSKFRCTWNPTKQCMTQRLGYCTLCSLHGGGGWEPQDQLSSWSPHVDGTHISNLVRSMRGIRLYMVIQVMPGYHLLHHHLPRKSVSLLCYCGLDGSPTLSSSGSWWPIFPNANWDCASAWMASWMIFKKSSQFKPRSICATANKKCFKQKERPLALGRFFFVCLKARKKISIFPTKNSQPRTHGRQRSTERCRCRISFLESQADQAGSWIIDHKWETVNQIIMRLSSWYTAQYIVYIYIYSLYF